MANLIDSLSKNKSLVSETSSKNEKEAVKEGPSLFDSLLKESSEESIKTDNKNSVNKEEPKNTAVDKEEVKTEVKAESEESVKKSEENTKTEESKVDVKSENKNSQGSLLDRLVIEAKKESETAKVNVLIGEAKEANKVEENTLLDNVQKEEPKNTAVDKEEVKAESEESVKKSEENTKTEESKVDVKSENKNSQGSLLDRLVIEAKKESETAKVNVLVGEVKEASKVEENTLLDNKVTLNKEEPKNTAIEQEEVKTEVIAENEESKVDVKSENKNSQGSLLDRLVIEAKKESETAKVNVLVGEVKEASKVEENTLLDNVQKEEPKNTVVGKEEVKTLILQESEKDVTTSVENSLDITSEEINILDEIKTPVEEKVTSLNVKQEGVLSNLVMQDNTLNQENLIDETKPKEKQSLMDLLILKNSQKTLLNENGELVKNQSSSNEFISNMYLSSQKNVLNNQLLFNKKEAMTLLQEGQTLQNVEKSADLLDLGLENIDVEQTLGSGKKLDIKQQDLELLNRKSILDKLFIEKNIKSDDLKGLITQSIEASKALMDDTLTVQDDVAVNVNSPLSYNIQSRIIGAKQQMSMMMSDIARQMYENYKPPVTVFKINLNPLELGSISILMKNDRNNGLNISMNVSNMTTLDALIENQNLLKNSLNKTFDENTAFNLDFNSSNQGDGQSENSQNNQENQRFGREQVDTQTLLQLKEENKDREDNLDYM